MTKDEALKAIKYELCVRCPCCSEVVDMDGCRMKDRCEDAQAVAVLEKKGHCNACFKETDNNKITDNKDYSLNKLRFEWKDTDYGYHECILYEGDKEINDIYFNDYTTEFNQKSDKENKYKRPYAFEVGWCHGWSMSEGFDYDENYDEHRDDNGYRIGGYQGKCTHTVDDIKKWCENWLAQQYLSRYYKTLENLEQLKQRAMWFESQGFVYEEGE